jgi:putative mRNA 3-end processing factor
LVQQKSSELAKVTNSGAILLGNIFEVDSFAGKPVRVVSHFHSDHTILLSKSGKFASHILATPATIEALPLMGFSLPEDKLLPLEYGRSIKFGEDSLVLVKSSHVIGSAQVLVETVDGSRVGYTGDFKFPGTKIMSDLDVLIIDATYGEETMVRPFKNEVDILFSDLVSELLSKGKPVIVKGYHGKLQEAMHIMRRFGVEAPFILPEKVYELTKLTEKHGLKVGNYFREGSEEAVEAIKGGWFVYLNHANSRKKTPFVASEVVLTGWFFSSPLKKIYENGSGERWVVALSDHADFEDTLYYVEEARPKKILIDAFRTSREIAEAFAKSVLRRLGKEAVVMPDSHGIEEED